MDQTYSNQMTKVPQGSRILFKNGFEQRNHERRTRPMRRKIVNTDYLKHVWKSNPFARLTALVLLIVLVTNSATAILTSRQVATRLEEKYAKDLAMQKWAAEQRIAAQLREEYGVTEAEALEIQIQEEAKTIAKILYPMRNNNARGLRSAVWCVLNRVDNPLDNSLRHWQRIDRSAGQPHC